jgi:hypothetical protein
MSGSIRSVPRSSAAALRIWGLESSGDLGLARRRRKRGANGSWGEAYTFDGFGNLTGQTLAGRLAYRHMAPDRTLFGSIIGAPYD